MIYYPLDEQNLESDRTHFFEDMDHQGYGGNINWHNHLLIHLLLSS